MIKPKQFWQLQYPNLSQEEAYKKGFPKLSKYINKNVIVIPADKYTMYKIFGKFTITKNDNDGEFTVKSSDKKSYITFDSGNIVKIQKKDGKIYFIVNI